MSEPTLTCREYGNWGPTLLLIHGGPGAPGNLAPVARALANRLHVLEPFQRAGGAEPLTVARHVADMHGLIASRCPGERPALVGHSWGAMLALAFASAHPDEAGPIALIGCGTFDPASRAHYRKTVDERIGPENMALVAKARATDREEHIRLMTQFYPRADRFDPLPEDASEHGPVDAKAHEETWSDMMRCQAEGLYPAAFSRIASPAIMLHGSFDPHPGRMIFEGLRPFIPALEYREFERCGHYPWLERAAREEFFAALGGWLAERMSLS